MYIRQYDARNQKKKKTNERKSIHSRPGQIWHCVLGVNIGSEEDGKGGFLRPIVVLGYIGNMVLVAPTTSVVHLDSIYYTEILSVDFGVDTLGDAKRSFVMLSQIRTISSKRLIKHKYTISDTELASIKKSLSVFLL